MPVVYVSGVPTTIQPVDMVQLRRVIQTAVMGVEELQIEALDWTSVYFLAQHHCDTEDPQRIVIEVAGLFRGDDWPERTPAVRQKLASQLGQMVGAFITALQQRRLGCGSVRMIEVLEWPFDTTLSDPLGGVDVPSGRHGYFSIELNNAS